MIGDTAPWPVRRLEAPVPAADDRAMRAGAHPADDCPPARPGRRTTQSRTRQIASVRLRGVASLAARLAVPEAAVRGWIDGSDAPPQPIFLAAVDLILLDAEKRARSPS